MAHILGIYIYTWHFLFPIVYFNIQKKEGEKQEKQRQKDEGFPERYPMVHDPQQASVRIPL